MQPNTRALRRFAATSLAFVLAAAPAAADSPAPADSARTVRSGDRVRIGRAGQSALVGRLVDVGPESVSIDTRPRPCTSVPDPDCAPIGSVLVPRRDIQRLDVSLGRRSYWRVGAAIGATAGLALGLSSGRGEPEQMLEDELRPFAAGIGALILGMLGGLTGEMLSTEKWRAAQLEHVSLEVQPLRGGGRLAVTLRF